MALSKHIVTEANQMVSQNLIFFLVVCQILLSVRDVNKGPRMWLIQAVDRTSRQDCLLRASIHFE